MLLWQTIIARAVIPKRKQKTNLKTYSSSNDDGRLSALEGPEGFFTLFLGSVTVDGGDRESLAIEELVKLVGTLLSLHEHQSQAWIFVAVVVCNR